MKNPDRFRSSVMLAGLWSLLIVFVVIPATTFAARDVVFSLDSDMAALNGEIKAAQRSLAKSGPGVKPGPARKREVKSRTARPGAKPQMARPTVKPPKRELPIPLGKMEKQLRSLSRTVAKAEQACPRCRSAREMAKRVKALTGSVKALAQAKNRGDRPEALKILSKMSGTLGTIENQIGRLASEMRKEIQPQPGRGKIKRKPQSGKPVDVSQPSRSSGAGDDARLDRTYIQKRNQLIQVLSTILKKLHGTTNTLTENLR